jgi:transaldolase
MTTTASTNVRSDNGVVHWLDGLRQSELESDQNLQVAHSGGVVGAVFNPTTFHQEIASGTYDSQLADLAGEGRSVDDAVRHIVADDGRRAADVMRAAYEATDGLDGLVTVGMAPQRTQTTPAIVDEAGKLWELVERPNVLVAVPPSPEGLAAVGELLGAGINVSITPVFSPERYREAVEVLLSGLAAAGARGGDLSSLSSAVSVAVSPVDTEVDKLLWKIGTDEAAALRGKAALANAGLAHREHDQVVELATWQQLQSSGTRPPRLVWIAVAPSDPYYGPTHYVDHLTMLGVACAMNQATLDALADQGVSAGDASTSAGEDPATMIARFEAVGVDHASAVRSLDDRGVERFNRSWKDLLVSVRSKLEGR